MLKKRKNYLWVPYTSNITVQQQTVKLSYKGGELKVKWKNIHSIMFYGEGTAFPQEFLEKCAFYKIPVVIHRRNIPRAVIISSTLPPDKENLLTKQIIFRENKKKQAYISKKLLQAKFKSMSWLLPVNHDLLYRVYDTQKMINIEALHAKRYWYDYFLKLNIRVKRRSGLKNEITKKTLNAASKFVSGIILRWILYHNLSPYHGFLHKPTDYPSLVYDLMEPYRGFFDKVVFNAVQQAKNKKIKDEKKYIAYAIEKIKEFLDAEVYINATRQIVTFHEVLHGIVLALRAYLLTNTRRFIIPFPSKPNGGRPIKAGYKLYGHHAGITNFWPQTKKLEENFEQTYFAKNN